MRAAESREKRLREEREEESRAQEARETQEERLREERAVLLRLVMQVAMIAVFDVGLEVNIDVHDNLFNMQSGRAQEATEAARTLYEEVKKQLNVRGWRLLLDEEGKEAKGKVLCTS